LIVDRKGEQLRQANWLAVIPLTLAAVAIAVPWLVGHTPAYGFALQRGFALVCHQQAERSFFVFGGSVAVCARCLGIYCGAAVGMLMRVSRRIAWRWLMAAVAINAIDRAAELGGLHSNWMLLRFVLGIAVGMTAAMMVAGFEVEMENPAAAVDGALGLNQS
jgi:uncharacterized membrane protein